MGLALLLVSCEKEKIPTTINEVTDLYTVPADAVEMPSLSQAESVWSLDRRYFNLAFGSALSTTLVGFDAILTPGQYVLGADQIGNAVLNKTKVNGQQPSEGYITVNRDNKGTYHISATVDGNAYYWNGTMPFTPDPAPVMLTVVQQAQSNVANGTNSLTLQLATEGIAQSFDWTTWQTTWTGEGGYLALDIYSDDGYLHNGVYTACAEGGVINPGEFGIGWDPGDIYGIGMEFTDWGTCWWDVKDGAATATKITGGVITVNRVDDGWEISWGEAYPEELVFAGAIPALTKPDKPVGPTAPDYLYTETIEPGEGVDKHIVTITDKDSNELAHLELLLASGATDLAGSYPSTSYASEPGQMCDGYYIDAGDWGIFEGGSYYIEGGEKKYIGAGAATVEVTKIATGAYQFSCAFFSYSAAGPDYVPEEGGGNDGPVLDMEDTVAVDCTDAANTLYEDVESHTLVLKEGETFVAQIKLVRKVGTTDLSGDYTVGEYAHEDLIAANGFDLGAMFGMDPGAWVIGSYYVQDGTIKIIEPGETIKVTSVGDKTYKFVGSTGYTFVGKLK